MIHVRSYPNNVRFTPESGHVQCNSLCPLCAKSGLYAPQQTALLFDHFVGGGKQSWRNG